MTEPIESGGESPALDGDAAHDRRPTAGQSIAACRALAADPGAEVISGGSDVLIKIREGRLAGNKVVTTVMSNFGLYKALDEVGVGYEKTAVGDRFVYENMAQNGYCVGGEQSGHIILSKYATTGDGTLTALHLLARMADTGRPLAELAQVMTQLPQVLINVRDVDKASVGTSPGLAAAVRAAETTLGETGRVLMRSSGTEPVVRVMVEAPSESQARAVAEELAGAVAREIPLG